MTSPVLTLSDVHKSFGATAIIRGANLELMPGERHALIGPNGAGKSTLFHLISGHLTPTSGDIHFKGQRLNGRSPQDVNRMGLSRSFQITNLFPKLSVMDNLRLAAMRPMGLQFNAWRWLNRHTGVNQEAQRLMELVRLGHRAEVLAGELAYSEQRSLEIAMTLASDPQVILLDEPMAGMSQEETTYTANLIREVTQGRALLIVEHDMDVVFSISDRISVLVYGQVIATGTPSDIRGNPAVREAYLGEEVSA